MLRIFRYTVLTLFVTFTAAKAAEHKTTPVPAIITAMAGCWQGEGEVMGKPVTLRLVAKPVALGAMVTFDFESTAKANPKDRYAAHLIFGGGDNTLSGYVKEAIVSFWADSFGGAFAKTGRGRIHPDGFEVAYGTLTDTWKISGTTATWQIIEHDGGSKPETFAQYSMTKTTCPR